MLQPAIGAAEFTFSAACAGCWQAACKSSAEPRNRTSVQWLINYVPLKATSISQTPFTVCIPLKEWSVVLLQYISTYSMSTFHCNGKQGNVEKLWRKRLDLASLRYLRCQTVLLIFINSFKNWISHWIYLVYIHLPFSCYGAVLSFLQSTGSSIALHQIPKAVQYIHRQIKNLCCGWKKTYTKNWLDMQDVG